jgi:hypothetical protein
MGDCPIGSYCAPLDQFHMLQGTCVVGGYTMSASTASWIDACAAPGMQAYLAGRDDAVALTSLPFMIEFYGRSVSVFGPSPNGWLSFDTSSSPFWNSSQQFPAIPYNAIHVFDANLRFGTGTPTPQLCTATTGTAPNRTYTVEWFNAEMVDPPTTTPLTAEVQFVEGSNAFDVLYQSVPTTGPGEMPIVGVESPGGSSFTTQCAPATTPCTPTTVVNTRYTPP